MLKPPINIGSVLTVVISIFGSLGSGVYFLTKMEGRLTAIERDAQDRERRVARLEENFRLIYPIIQRDQTNLNWLMKKQKDGRPEDDNP